MTIKYGLELENALLGGKPVAETSIGRAVAPRSLRLWRLRRWRWDVTWYQTMQGDNPGVYNQRWHLSADCGYTVTFRGAALKLAQCIEKGRLRR